MRLESYERMRTVGLLLRFFRLSIQVGRMPSLLGREVIPSKMRAQPARVFEDTVVFVCDVERCLRGLGLLEQRLIAFCILEEHSEWEAARQFRQAQSEVSRKLGNALDMLHSTFCRVGLLVAPTFNAAQEDVEKGEA